jgi:phage shock protein PspC (stress-responsive transcriptional regulator)
MEDKKSKIDFLGDAIQAALEGVLRSLDFESLLTIAVIVCILVGIIMIAVYICRWWVRTKPQKTPRTNLPLRPRR